LLRPIDLTPVIEETLEKAGKSPRRRANQCFHSPEETLQRMVNSCRSDTYVGPHRHGSHVKIEIFFVLKGKGVMVSFDDRGEITSCVTLDEKGPVKMVEIPPQNWHALVVFSEEASFLEIVEGKYDPVLHKELPKWAPEEGKPGVKEYLDNLKRRVLEFEKRKAVTP
jgi:cupin fold WbuC family metalloprotein